MSVTQQRAALFPVDGMPQPSITSWPLASGTIINGGNAKLTIGPIFHSELHGHTRPFGQE